MAKQSGGVKDGGAAADLQKRGKFAPAAEEVEEIVVKDADGEEEVDDLLSILGASGGTDVVIIDEDVVVEEVPAPAPARPPLEHSLHRPHGYAADSSFCLP